MKAYSHTGKEENFELYESVRKRWSELSGIKTRDETGFGLSMIHYWNDWSHHVLCVIYFILNDYLFIYLFREREREKENMNE